MRVRSAFYAVLREARRRLRIALYGPPPPPPAPPPPPPRFAWATPRAISLMTLGVATASAVATYLALWGTPFASDTPEANGRKTAELHVDQLLVRDGNSEAVHSTTHSGRHDEALPAVDVTLRNSGDGSAVVVEVKAQILDFGELTYCGGGGGGGEVPLTQSYTLRLPSWPLPHERVVTSRFAYHIPPHDIGRFTVRFDAASPAHEAFELYLLDMTLETRGGAGRIELGRILVATDGPPPRSGDYFPEESRALPISELPEAAALRMLWCHKLNLMTTDRFTRVEAERTPEIAALADIEVVPTFRTALRRVPPRAAAHKLLRGGTPNLAVAAATAAGDGRLEAAVRQKAARAMHEKGRLALRSSADTAAYYARVGLALHETERLTRLLADAHRRAEHR